MHTSGKPILWKDIEPHPPIPRSTEPSDNRLRMKSRMVPDGAIRRVSEWDLGVLILWCVILSSVIHQLLLWPEVMAKHDLGGLFQFYVHQKKQFFTITKVPCPQGREPRLLKYMVSLRACWSTRSSWTKAEMDEIWNSRWRDWACRKKKYSNLSGTMFKHALIWWSPTTQDFCGMNSPANPRNQWPKYVHIFGGESTITPIKNMMDHGS